MDPEGVREVFYAECGAAPDYRFRETMRSLPFLARWNESFFFGLHLPLTRPLPKRLDTTLQQHVGMHQYDAIVLADIDPSVLDADDLLNLLAYVEAGGGLLLLGGPHSFSSAQRNWGPLREALPAGIVLRPERSTKLWNDHFPADSPRPSRPVTVVGDHAVTAGLTGPLGRAMHAHPLRVKAGADVLATAEDEPLIAAAPFGAGRVLMVGAYPGDAPDDLFRTPAWADVLRQSLSWLMKRERDIAIVQTEADAGPMALGNARTFSIRLAAATPPVRVCAVTSRADPGWLAVGREPQFGSLERHDVLAREDRVDVEFRPTLPGLWRTRLELHGVDWDAVRVFDCVVTTPLALRLCTRNGEYVTTPGGQLALRLNASEPVRATLEVIDPDGGSVWSGEDVETGPVDIALPQLELGDYEVVARCGDDCAHLRFCVTDPLPRVPFSLAANATGPTEERIRWWHEYFRCRGFDAFATAPASPDEPGVPDGFRAIAYQHYLVQREGGMLWGEYTGAALISTHGTRGEEGSRPTTPCVLDPAHAARLRELLSDRFRGASASPRMTSLEILDEPHLYRADVCRCPRCIAAFREQHGYEMPTWDEALAARDGRTRDYFEWIIGYAAEAFRKGYEIWKSFGPGPNLHHVLCAMGSGQTSAANSVAEDLPWSPHADFIEFDCYNYMYPNWRASVPLRWSEFHYLMGHFRFLALRNGQRIGFFIQVTDRDAPVTPWDPLRAPSETLYTAIAGGAKTFHLMAKGPFSNTQNCREEKFDTFAGDIRKVRTVAPLLDLAETPRSGIAMVFPFHDRLYRFPEHRLPEGYIGLGFYGLEHRPCDTLWPYHKASVNVAELLFRAFGELDVIDQRALREGALSDYGGFVLTGTDYMDPLDADAVERFVRDGGALICDHVPSHDLDGTPRDWLRSICDGESEHLYRETTLTRSRVGNGACLLLSDDLNELYTGSVERDDRRVRRRIEDTVRRFFFDAGLRPHVLSSHTEVEAAVLLTRDTTVLVCVNHSDQRREAELTVFAPAPAVAHCVDLVTMEPHSFAPAPEGIRIDVDLADREGLILGLYAAVPSRLAVVPDRPEFAAGTRLAFTVELTDDAGRRVRGDHIVEIRVTDARGDERRQFGGLLCATNGVLRIDAPLAVNARRGCWTLAAFDRFTTRCAKARVTVT